MSDQTKQRPNVDKFWTWVTAHPIRWTRIVWGAALIVIFVTLAELSPVVIPTEAWFLAIGVIIGAFANAMNAPDPSKTELLTFAEKVMDKLGAK